MRTFTSRTATRVKNGRVQPKNRNRPTGHQGCVIDRESPGQGYQHVVTKSDLQSFLDIIPDWDRYSERLERIVLAAPGDHCDGMYEFFHREESGVIYLHAWAQDLWVEMMPHYFQAHQHIYDKLGVRYDIRADSTTCYFSPAQARAYTLLHVFLHELGHHFDRIHQKHLGATKDEDYAEHFANSRLDTLLPLYTQVFGPPANKVALFLRNRGTLVAQQQGNYPSPHHSIGVFACAPPCTRRSSSATLPAQKSQPSPSAAI